MPVVPQRNTRGAWVVGGNAAAGEHGFGREDRGVVVYPVRDENRRLNLVHDQVDWVAAHRGRLESPLRHDVMSGDTVGQMSRDIMDADRLFVTRRVADGSASPR